jgi:hypothetical protein
LREEEEQLWEDNKRWKGMVDPLKSGRWRRRKRKNNNKFLTESDAKRQIISKAGL